MQIQILFCLLHVLCSIFSNKKFNFFFISSKTLTVALLEKITKINYFTGPEDNIIMEEKYAVTEDEETWVSFL
jgi:hypothetical protein